jgi:predicted acylesterase/phospholipase RssA
MPRLVALLAFVLLAACGGTNSRAIPSGFDFATAAPYGIPGVAHYGREGPADIVARARGPVIAFSGGGELGAFGAGLVTGWTERGDRPDFATVTGVSTGSILALFTFLGPDYDDELTAIYTTYDTKDLLTTRILPAVLGAPAVNSADGYRRLIDRYIDQAVLDRIAKRAAEGRRLVVVSTDLDREQPVHWDLTALATSGHPDALQLLRDIIQASSAIPVIFPPVMIPVIDSAGHRYESMHVDGGTTLQFTLMGLGSSVVSAAQVPEVYLVLNQFPDAVPSAKAPHIIPVASAAMSTMIESAVLSEADRVAGLARQSGIPIRIATIPADFTRPTSAEFDPPYMRSLVELGRKLMREGRAWTTSAPGDS